MSKDHDHNRQPKGVPVGGQFANKVNPESTLELVDEVGPIDASSFMNERVEQLRQHGFVSATTAPLLVDPRSSAHRKEWWTGTWLPESSITPKVATHRCRTTGRRHTHSALPR